MVRQAQWIKTWCIAYTRATSHHGRSRRASMWLWRGAVKMAGVEAEVEEDRVHKMTTNLINQNHFRLCKPILSSPRIDPSLVNPESVPQFPTGLRNARDRLRAAAHCQPFNRARSDSISERLALAEAFRTRDKSSKRSHGSYIGGCRNPLEQETACWKDKFPHLEHGQDALMMLCCSRAVVKLEQ
jgi:hypothetical protein